MLKKQLSALLLAFILFCNIFSAWGSTPNKKTMVDVNGFPVYVSAQVYFNYDKNGMPQRTGYIGDLDVRYDADTYMFYVTVKRSQINNIIEDTDTDVYSLLHIYFEVQNLPADAFLLYQNGPDQGNGNYKLDFPYYGTPIEASNYYQIFSSAIELNRQNAEGQYSYGGGRILSVDTAVHAATAQDDQKVFTVNDVDKTKVLLYLPQTKTTITILEDEAIDMGNIGNIIASDSDLGNLDGGMHVQAVDNYYAQYFEDQKLLYSWTTYDENGNPIEFENNMNIQIDSSAYESEIMEQFDNGTEQKDKFKFLSFEHHGQLGGTATIKVYVGDRFHSKDLVNLFYYDQEVKEIDTISEKLVVDENGYVSFELDHCSEYVLADASLKIAAKPTDNASSQEAFANEGSSPDNSPALLLWWVVGIVLLVICTGGIVLFFVLKKHQIQKNNV